MVIKMKFKLVTILSITSGYHCLDIDDRFEILSYMTNQKLFAHQLDRATPTCKKHLIALYPELSQLPENTGKERLTPAEINAYITMMIKKLGDELDVTPLPLGTFEYIDPVTELRNIMGNDRVVIINIDKGLK